MLDLPSPMNNTITYKKGDVIDAALSGEYDMFWHGCNCFKTMGAGVALGVRERMPWLYQADQNFSYSPEVRFGDVSVAKDPNSKTIGCNLYTQFDFNPHAKPFSYGAFANAMQAAMREYFMFHDYDDSLNVCLPKIGAGLAGGDWVVIEEMLKTIDLDGKINFTVYIYE